jgi:dUTPase
MADKVAAKHSIDTGAGVIDADYRGPVKVLLFNFSDEDFTGMSLSERNSMERDTDKSVKHGDRVAQLILERIVMAPLLEVDVSRLV